MDQECASKPYHGLIMYIHNNIELLNITMFPGKDIEGIQVVIKKVLQSVYHHRSL